MYQLHIANKNYSSWSLRPWVLLREQGIDFNENMHIFTKGYGQNTDFKAFSPTALVPALQDGDVTIWESMAIVEYLYESHPSVWPRDKTARAFARSAAAEMHAGFSALRSNCSMNCGLRIKLSELTPAIKSDLARIDALWGEGLTRFGGPFLAGDSFTTIDAFFAPVVFRVQTYDLPLSVASSAYVSRILALNSMQQWYEEALLETTREDAHEAEARANGLIVADYRK